MGVPRRPGQQDPLRAVAIPTGAGEGARHIGRSAVLEGRTRGQWSSRPCSASRGPRDAKTGTFPLPTPEVAARPRPCTCHPGILALAANAIVSAGGDAKQLDRRRADRGLRSCSARGQRSAASAPPVHRRRRAVSFCVPQLRFRQRRDGAASPVTACRPACRTWTPRPAAAPAAWAPASRRSGGRRHWPDRSRARGQTPSPRPAACR